MAGGTNPPSCGICERRAADESGCVSLPELACSTCVRLEGELGAYIILNIAITGTDSSEHQQSEMPIR